MSSTISGWPEATTRPLRLSPTRSVGLVMSWAAASVRAEIGRALHRLLLFDGNLATLAEDDGQDSEGAITRHQRQPCVGVKPGGFGKPAVLPSRAGPDAEDELRAASGEGASGHAASVG